MRILQLTAFYLPSVGGIQYYVRNLSQALVGLTHSVTILTVNTDGAPAQERRPEGMVLRCALNASYHRGLVSAELVNRLMSLQGYDVIHAHIPFPLGLEAAALGSKLRGTPLVVTHHGTGPKDDRLYMLVAGLYDKIYRHLSLRAARRVVFLTNSYREEIALPPRVAARTRIVRTGADTARFNPHVDGSAVRARYGFSSQDVVALWVGSLNEHNRYKGIDYLLMAIARPQCAAVKALIVGDGALRSGLQDMAEQLGLADRVRFVGTVDNSLLPEYYAASDFFVLPSIHGPENSPVVVFEAMASGRAVVASDIPGVREIVEHERTGLLVSPKDVGALADALSRIGGDHGARTRWAANARAKACEHSWERVAERMVGLYHEAAHARLTTRDRKGTRPVLTTGGWGSESE
jgi:glycosyltransferase involved in cell wall biosynthesis